MIFGGSQGERGGQGCVFMSNHPFNHHFAWDQHISAEITDSRYFVIQIPKFVCHGDKIGVHSTNEILHARLQISKSCQHILERRGAIRLKFLQPFSKIAEIFAHVFLNLALCQGFLIVHHLLALLHDQPHLQMHGTSDSIQNHLFVGCALLIKYTKIFPTQPTIFCQCSF